MYQNSYPIRRHAELIAGQPIESKHPDVGLWSSRLRKAIVAGDLPARRQRGSAAYLATKKDVGSWFRAYVKEVGVAAAWTFMILSPMLLPGGAL